MPRLLRLAVPLLCAPCAAYAAGVSGGFGGFGTVGSDDRSGLGIYADAEAAEGLWRPLGWALLRAGEDARELGLGGGAWRDLQDGLWGKLTLGLTFGRDARTDQGLDGVAFAGALEGRAEGWTAGGDYGYSIGELSPSGSSAAARGHGRGRLRVEPAGARGSFAYHELGGYGRRSLGRGTGGLRVAFGFPSGGGLATSEEASLSWPLVEPLASFGSLAFEQFEGENSVLFTFGLDYRFP